MKNYRVSFRKIAGGDLSFKNTSWIEFATRNSNTFTGTQHFPLGIWDLNGKVGIGTASPDPNFTLSVNGKIKAKEIKAKEIKVTLAGWSDFVFEPNYKLRPLSEVESFIQKNRHLPDIPSAKEVAKEGVAVGEMEAKLLQKIEELTLYMIDLKKENERQQREIDVLKNKTK